MFPSWSPSKNLDIFVWSKAVNICNPTRKCSFIMDASLKELTRLETLTASDGKSPSIIDSLDSLLGSLHEAKEEFLISNCTEEQLNQLTQTIESKKKEVEDRQKEVYSVMSRFGRTLDKVGLLMLSREISSFRRLSHRNSQRRCPRTPIYSPPHLLLLLLSAPLLCIYSGRVNLKLRRRSYKSAHNFVPYNVMLTVSRSPRSKYPMIYANNL